MKYIDAEKLLDIVIKMQKEYATQEVTEEHKGLKAVLGGQCFVLTEIIRIIDSLQQEQSDVDLEKQMIYETTISADKTIPVLPMKDVSDVGFDYGDKVIVQIRKK